MEKLDFEIFASTFMLEVSTLLQKKGEDYCIKPDQLSSFKVNAEMTGLTPMQVWTVLAAKHFNAIVSGKAVTESLRSRFLDLAAYCVLGAAILEDK